MSIHTASSARDRNGSRSSSCSINARTRSVDQLALEVAEPRPYPSLQRHIVDKYAGRTVTFLDLLNDDYPDGVWLEPEYRWALDGMEKEKPPRASVARNRKTPAGRPATRGIQYPDTITFR